MNEEIHEVHHRDTHFQAVLRTRFDLAFWTRWLSNAWEEDTFDFVDEHVRPGTAFIDIGGWIGPIALYAAARGARVISIEPDPVAYASLSRNAELNAGRLAGSIEVRQAAFDAAPGNVRIRGNAKGFGTSGSSTLARGWSSITVPAITRQELVDWVAGSPAVMKVDIEGHEYFCAGELARLRQELDAPLNLSVHPLTLRKSLGWRSWFGRGMDQVLDRTVDLMTCFDDSDVQATDAPHGTDRAALQERLFPSEGDPNEFVVTALPKSG